MNTSALITMLVTESIIASVTFYFFWRVLKTPPRPEEDSYSDNDEEER